jgi:hypothetical protein
MWACVLISDESAIEGSGDTRCNIAALQNIVRIAHAAGRSLKGHRRGEVVVL